MKLSDKYRMVTKVTIKSRDTAMFWAHKWMPHKSFLRLFSFEIDQTLSVKEVLLLTDKTELFHMPLSQQAHEELDRLQSWIVGVTLVPAESDSWNTIWKGGVYTTKSLYQYTF
jgi:hypothetical protein